MVGKIINGQLLKVVAVLSSKMSKWSVLYALKLSIQIVGDYDANRTNYQTSP